MVHSHALSCMSQLHAQMSQFSFFLPVLVHPSCFVPMCLFMSHQNAHAKVPMPVCPCLTTIHVCLVLSLSVRNNMCLNHACLAQDMCPMSCPCPLSCPVCHSKQPNTMLSVVNGFAYHVEEQTNVQNPPSMPECPSSTSPSSSCASCLKMDDEMMILTDGENNIWG